MAGEAVVVPITLMLSSIFFFSSSPLFSVPFEVEVEDLGRELPEDDFTPEEPDVEGPSSILSLFL